ncbi:TraR/DksA C4-type zinc finger protein [Sporosarcina aquimarina]|uniref:TraR/DksA C4-type zinc finger protein n=1 Tax=Sporosarcina aquimarina TaxID=114975 RepID=A0ABU4FZN6_9BACL|nr:TraR/DksA C4-type zinc finger protein [Sporosarcina aquimarina]MDW0110175.1 TraR/DksA C4-type zinc finger protein [Sporosarcina aquimarina]
MLTKEQTTSLKKELLRLQDDLTATENRTDVEESAQEEVGELSTYDNHPADMGTELYDREKDRALNVHASSELEKVEQALEKMNEGSYGVCEVCGKEIPYERLEAIPYTTFCVEDAVQEVPDDRPVEDDLLKMANPNTFADRRDGAYEDGIDSFEAIAKSGTSETPSDFTGDHDDYESLYDTAVEDESTEDIDVIATSNMEGEPSGIVRGDTTLEYEQELDEEGLESELGDIPYRRKDSYTDN